MNPWIVLFGVVAITVVYVVGPIAVMAFWRWRRPWRLTCPRVGTMAQIKVAAARGAVAEALGRRVEIERCSQWPALLGCRRDCLSQSPMTWRPMRPGDPPPRARAEGPLRMIVVPLDGRQGSEAVLPAVRELAQHSGATVRLLRVVGPVGEVHSADEEDRVVVYADQETQRVETEARDYMHLATQRLPGITVEHAVRIGDVAHAVVDEAEAAEADLIAMATHRRRGLGRLVKGSVAGRLERRTTIPLLLVTYGESAG